MLFRLFFLCLTVLLFVYYLQFKLFVDVFKLSNKEKFFYFKVIFSSRPGSEIVNKIGQGEVLRRNHLIRLAVSIKTKRFCYFSKERQISIVMFIKSNLLFSIFSSTEQNQSFYNSKIIECYVVLFDL